MSEEKFVHEDVFIEMKEANQRDHSRVQKKQNSLTDRVTFGWIVLAVLIVISENPNLLELLK